MKKTPRISILTAFTISLIFGALFVGVPEAQAATVTKTWSFAADAESWTATNPAPTQTATQWQSADGSPANGSLEMRITGKNKSNSGRIWEIADTWEAIFGIPAGSTVTEVGSGTGNSYNYRVSEYNVGAAGNSGPFEFYDNTPALQGAFSAATAFSGLVAWTAKTGAAVSVPAGLQASNNTVRFRITNDLATGNNNGAAVTLRQDQIVLTITYTPPVQTTTLGGGTNPGNATVAPGGAATEVDSFTFQTSTGTDTITAATVTLAVNTTSSIAEVAITSDNGATVYGSSTNPTANSFAVTLNQNTLTASTTQTQFKIRITPKSHANMPVPPGSTYTVTSTITAWSGTNTQAGSDATSSVLTIDNLSPNGATATSTAAGNQQVTLNWTTSVVSDFASSVILRWTGASPGSETPAEGTDYSVDTTINTATVACVRTGDAVLTGVSGVDGAGTGGCSAVALTNDQAYSYEVFQKDSSGNYDVGVSMGSATPFAPTVSCNTDVTSTAFGTLATTTIATASPNASSTMTCNGAAGCTLYIQDAGSGSSPGLATSSPAYLIPSPASGFPASATLAAGTEGYGVIATTTAAGSGGILGIGSRYLQDWNGNTVGGLTLSTTLLASSTAAVTGREVVVKHRVAISVLTTAASYVDTITYSCVGN